MSTHIAEHYAAEMSEWRSSIAFYHQEMEGLEGRLGDLVRRNSIPDIGEKADAHQEMLNTASDRFLMAQVLMSQQEDALRTNGQFIDDGQVKDEIEKKQQEIRRTMQEAEQEFIDAKYKCLDFLSGMLGKQE